MRIQFVRVHFTYYDSEWTIAVFDEDRDMHAVIQEYVEEAKKIYKWDEDQDDSAVIGDVLIRLTEAGYVFKCIAIDEILVD